MKNELHMVTERKAETSRPDYGQPTYLGYINGRLTRFFLKSVPGTNQYIKVEVAM